MRFMKKIALRFAFSLLVLTPVFALDAPLKSPLEDPGIGNGEHAVYKIKNKRGTFTIEDTVTISKDGHYYIVESHTSRATRILKLSRETMFPLQLDTYTDKSDYRINSVKKVEYKGNLKDNTIPVITNFDTEYVLRGYPFEKPKKLIIDFISESESERTSSFEISVVLAGKENVDIGKTTIPCYVLEFQYRVTGIFRLFKSMFPKTRVWYSVCKPHYMVKYQNTGGQGDSGNMTILLADYSGWRQNSF